MIKEQKKRDRDSHGGGRKGGSLSPLQLPKRVGRGGARGVAHGRPWLPRGGATALGGGATELMGDVVIFLLSERQTDKQTRETKAERTWSKKVEERERKKKEKKKIDRKKRWWKKRIRKEGRKEEQSGNGVLSLGLQYCSRPPDVSVCTSLTAAVTF